MSARSLVAVLCRSDPNVTFCMICMQMSFGVQLMSPHSSVRKSARLDDAMNRAHSYACNTR